VLHVAAYKGHASIVEVLLHAAADVFATDKVFAFVCGNVCLFVLLLHMCITSCFALLFVCVCVCVFRMDTQHSKLLRLMVEMTS